MVAHWVVCVVELSAFEWILGAGSFTGVLHDDSWKIYVYRTISLMLNIRIYVQK